MRRPQPIAEAERFWRKARVRELTDDRVRAILLDDRDVWEVAAEHGVSETTVWAVRSRGQEALVRDFPGEAQE